MKHKRIYIHLACLLFIVFSSCQKEIDPTGDHTFPSNAKLKRILLYSSIEADEAMSIVEEYEYDEKGRVSKVSSPMYQDNEITGTIKYDLYTYNSLGQLEKIEQYNANTNSTTGFLNLVNYSYTYSKDGKLEKEYIDYPQINSFEYSIFIYRNNNLSKIEKYGNTENLESYIENEYNNSDLLIKETTFGADNQEISYTEHLYEDGQNIRSDVYSGDNKYHLREIIRTFDENSNLITLESNELMLYSSAMSYVFKYEYFEE